MRRAILHTVVLGGGGFDSDALALFTAMDVQPTAARKALYNTFIKALKSGGVWTKLDALYLLAAHDADAALINIKNPGTFDATAVDSPTFTTDRGYAGNGTSNYLDTNFNPSTAGGNFTQDSACFGVWDRTSAQSSSIAGWFDGTDGVTLVPRSTSDTAGYRINQALQTSTGAGSVTDGAGLTVANRSASNVTQVYKNGGIIADSANPNQNSTALNNATLRLGSITAASFNTHQFAASIIGGSLTAGEQLALYNATMAYMQGVGAA